MQGDSELFSGPGTWLARQGRRLRWVARDLSNCVRGIPRLVRGARGSDEGVGIGLLEGGPWAQRGVLNAYRIRLVNDTPAACDIELRLRAEAAAKGPFEVCTRRVIERRTALELYFVTDWAALFEFRSAPPPIDYLRFLDEISVAESCRVKATLASKERRLDELVIVQGLVE